MSSLNLVDLALAIEPPAVLLELHDRSRTKGPVKCSVRVSQGELKWHFEAVFQTTFDAAVNALDRYPSATRISVHRIS